MKKILILIALLMHASIAFCQKDSTKNDSLHFSKVCFEGVCLGANITKKYLKFGRYVKFFSKGEGEMNDEPRPYNSYSYKKNDSISIAMQELLSTKTKNKLFNFPFNTWKNLDGILKIAGTIQEVQKKIPNSYKRAIKEKNINKTGTGRVFMKIYGNPEGFESVNTIIIELEKGKIIAIYTQDENSI